MRLFHEDQKYHDIQQRCRATQTLFEDAHFPADDSSLYFKKKPVSGEVVWKRPRDIAADPRLFVGGADCHSIQQGKVGNCWFVAAVSVLALHRDFLHQVVPSHHHQEWKPDKPEEYTGCFKFCFYRFGSWTEVVIDDRLPTYQGQLIYAHSAVPNEFWTALLEKAYAKTFGSYESLDAGNTSDALVDFTGGVTEELDLHSPEVLAKADSGELWKSLCKMRDRGAMMTCSIAYSDRSMIESELSNGLIVGHAYSITGIRKVKVSFLSSKKFKLLRIRNPWGQREWNGAWSDKSPEWNQISKREQQNLGLVKDDDGEFFISFEDFVKQFTDLKICYLVNTSYVSVHSTWCKTQFFGSWSKANRTAGGSINNKATFLANNSQYVFDVQEAGDVMVAVMQRDRRERKKSMHGNDKNLSIGFNILKVDENRKYRKHAMSDVVGSVTYINTREVFGRFSLAAGRYIVVPTTFEPNQEGEYFLRIFTLHFNHAKLLRRESPKHKIFVADPRGVLTVKVETAVGLPKQSILGKSADPYAVVLVDGRSSRSPVQKDTLSPVFHSSHVFYVRHPHRATIRVQIYNKNLTIDKFLGEVKLNVRDFMSRSACTVADSLKSKKGEPMAGSVGFSVAYSENILAT